jgi:two-component system sensor histidine kinase KdpD
MQGHTTNPDLRREFRSIALTAVLVGIVTVGVFGLVWAAGLRHGSVVYLVPVVIAATQWGLLPAIAASILGVLASTYFFYPPLYSLRITDPHEVLNLSLFLFVAIVTSQLARRLKRQTLLSRQREIDMRDLYEFSRRLAVAFDVSDIHSAIEDHLAAVVQRKVVLFASARDPSGGHRAGISVPDVVRRAVAAVADGQYDRIEGTTLKADRDELWLVRAVSSKSADFGIIAVNLGAASHDNVDDLHARVDTVLADANATLERLGVAHAISEARMRSQTDQLRDALIGSVSHELRTPLASIMGAATVLSEAPALKDELKLKALAHDVRDEAERLNNDIQNLLDATRISSNGVQPHAEWADPADIVHSALERCRPRMNGCRLVINVSQDLPMIRVDPVLVQQALVQIFDNAAKYSPSGSTIRISTAAPEGRLRVSVVDEGTGLTVDERAQMWNRFFRGERHIGTTSGSGLGLWIASAFVAANGGTIEAASAGPGCGATLTIELPIEQAAVSPIESEADE